jgi:uncharacterized protein YhaN
MGLTVYETEKYFKNQQKAANDAINSIKTYDAIKEIEELTGGVNELKNVFKELREEGFASAQTLLGLEEIFGKTDGWDEFFDTMASGVSTLEEAEEKAKLDAKQAKKEAKAMKNQMLNEINKKVQELKDSKEIADGI